MLKWEAARARYLYKTVRCACLGACDEPGMEVEVVRRVEDPKFALRTRGVHKILPAQSANQRSKQRGLPT